MKKPRSPQPRPQSAPSRPSRAPSFKRPLQIDEAPASSPEPVSLEKLAKIAGLPAVQALFRRDPDRVARLYYSEAVARDAGPLCAQLAQLRRPYRMVDDAELQRVAGTSSHGGIVAAAHVQTLADFDNTTLRQWASSREPLVILDGVGNPHNLGAIARTLAFFGFRYLLLSDHPAQAGLSDAAYRVAEGGLEYLEIRRVAQLPQMIQRLREHYHVVGTALGRKAVAPYGLRNTDKPWALILGNEEIGLSKATLAACDSVVQIPGGGWLQSLNVSVSAAILIHELARRRHAEQAPRRTAEVKHVAGPARRPTRPRS